VSDEGRASAHEGIVQLPTADPSVTDELLAAGVSKEDIVLGFYRPERRAISRFAVD
jgi:hypothetical protein